jgi:hypothetical protein
MLLEDVSSQGSLSSADFGRAKQEAASNPKGLALPPPTEFIKTPVDILDADSAILEAEREKQSLVWRARRHLRRVSDIAKDLAIKTWELLPKPIDPKDLEEELPAVEVSKEIDLDPEDQADTARTPVPIPAAKPRARSTEWAVTTQVVDMGRRKKARRKRPDSIVPIEDLTLDDEPKK